MPLLPYLDVAKLWGDVVVNPIFTQQGDGVTSPQPSTSTDTRVRGQPGGESDIASLMMFTPPTSTQRESDMASLLLFTPPQPSQQATQLQVTLASPPPTQPATSSQTNDEVSCMFLMPCL